MTIGSSMMYRMFVHFSFALVGMAFILGPSCASEHLTLDLDEYGRVDRGDFLQTIDPHIGNLVFVRGRISVNQVAYPEASHFPGGAHGEIYPCTENPFDVPLHEYPTRERIEAGLVPVPWFFNVKFVGYGNNLARSIDMERGYKSRHPLEYFELSDVHDKCVTIFGEISGERDIASVFLAGTLYIHNIYDTESSLGRE